jgi:hypothetical protein
MPRHQKCSIPITTITGFSIVIESACTWSPLVGIIQVDILKVQSPLFRRIAPVVLVAFLGTATVSVRYSASKTSRHNQTDNVFHVNDTGFGRPVMVTASVQIASTASRAVLAHPTAVFDGERRQQ